MPDNKQGRFGCVVVGVSTGGMRALHKLLATLPEGYTLPIVIVQHRHPSSDDYLVKFLDEKSPLKVLEAEEKEPLQKGMVYIAPADYHLLIEDDKTFSLSLEEPVHYARPSIDVLFESAAETFGGALIAIILTGASADGREGVKKVNEKGGVVIVQEPEDAECDIMPRAAIESGVSDYILPLDQIASLIDRLVATGEKEQKL